MKTSFNLSGITNELNHLQYGDRIRPVRDWFVLLSVCALLVVASVLFNVWFFFHITGENQGSATVGQAAATVPASLGSVTALFEKRSQEESKYETQYRFIDPSGSGS